MHNDIAIENIKNAYFVGIGGVSMSALAIILKNKGITVSGYDHKHSDTTNSLEQLGITIDYEHNLLSLEKVDTVIYTAAVTRETAPELDYADATGKLLLTRAELLGAVTASYKHSVGISGTHGKSTTTGMLSYIYNSYDSESSVIAGCVIPSIHSTYKIGTNDRVVFEACEYKDSFLEMRPSLKVVLNCSHDHVDYFNTLKDVISSFRKYVETPRPGQAENLAIVNLDCKNSVEAVKGCNARIYYYSIKESADFYAKNIVYNNGYASFSLFSKDKCLIEKISLSVPGEHNLSNAIAACGAAVITGIPLENIKTGIEQFCGVDRRFQKLGEYNNASIYDDYAHHPDEIKATLSTAKQMTQNRLICVFQPHTYSRTYALLQDFAKALSIADKVFLAEIYAAREQNIYNISSKDLCEKINNAEYFSTFEEISNRLCSYIQPKDIVITMGAGEAYKVAQGILNQNHQNE